MNHKFKRRYFHVTCPVALKVLSDGVEAYRTASDNLMKVVKEKWGISNVYHATSNGSFSAVRFEEGVVPDPNLWTKHTKSDRYWPRRNRKEGKEVEAEIRALMPKEYKSLLLEHLGLPPRGGPLVIAEGCGHGIGVMHGVPPDGSSPLALVAVPWLEITQEELDAYQADDLRSNTTLNWLIQAEPILANPAMVEIKEWEALKLVDDYEAKHKVPTP